jgi:flagellin-like protein
MDLISINTLLINSITLASINMSKLLRDKKAISPVIATVILVAVAITVAVAVAYWMSGIAGQYTAFEKVEIQSGYTTIIPTGEPNAGSWIIHLELKNTGSATSTLIRVFVNEVPIDPASYGFAIGTNTLDTGEMATDMPKDATSTGGKLPLVSGQSDTVEVYIEKSLFSSGTTLNIKLHSAGGMDYIKLMQLT